MRVRDYTPADHDACLVVFDSNVPKYFVTAERELFAAFLDSLPGPYLVLEDDDGAVVGCGGHAREPGTAVAKLCWGMVRQDRHRAGLGQLLLDARLERATADPTVGAVGLDTSQHTRGFYERIGFRTERVVPDGYAPGLDRCDMLLTLPPRRGRAESRGRGHAGAAGHR